MNQDQEYIQEFVTETREGLDRVDNVLISLETTTTDKKGLEVVFRVLHTIKGNSGFLDFPKLGSVAHAGETLLSQLTAGQLPISADIADVLLRLVDAIRASLMEIESTGIEGSSDHGTLIQEFAQWSAMASGESAMPLASRDTKSEVTPIPEPSPQSTQVGPLGQVRLSQIDHTILSDPELSQHVPPSVALPRPEVAAPPENAGQPQVAALPAASTPAPQDGSGSVPEVDSKVASEPENSAFVRVQIEQLDELMNLVGELVLARNRILQIASTRKDDELTEPIQRIHRLTSALQDGVMRTRMQPVRNAWRKYPRIVRDLAKKCGKLCELELQGGDTELDKSMLEAIADPLVHLVRNAIDHGIEKPYLRRIKGKPETGRLLVRSFQESGQVHVEVSDDGAGLDLDRIRQKAVEAGIFSPDKARMISETDLRNSVFLPGFSTADQVTNLSGRGVGMDVVKTCIEQIGGTIELQTKKDVGTTIRLTVPLTLAIVPAIMVYCGKHCLAIPQINVVEMLKLQTEDERKTCDHFHDTQVLRLRGELLPMANLSVALGVGAESHVETRDALHIVVLKTGTRRFALLVDQIGDPQEIVVKPLGDLLASQTQFSGAALMGDGTIALILDVLGIARSTGLLNTDNGRLNDTTAHFAEVSPLEEQVLVCQADGDHRIALPLSKVESLEQVPLQKIEYSTTGAVVQYRGDILTLYSLSRTPLPTPGSDSESGGCSIVVYRTEKSRLGLIVDRIVDVAPHPENICTVESAFEGHSRHRVVASAVVLSRVTEFLELN